MRFPVVVVVVLGAVGAGVVIGRGSRAREVESDAAGSCPPLAKVRERWRGGLVCARPFSSPDDDAEDSLEALSVRTRFCEAQLVECRRERKAVRQAWPDQDGPESPEAWTQAVEEAIDLCELPAVLEQIDCSEYPCTAALRPAEPIADEMNHENEMKALMAAARMCAPLRDAFGIAEEQVEKAIDVFRLDAKCGDTRENFFVLMALQPGAPAHTLISNDDKTAQEERDFWRWVYRRADDLAATWPCRE